jgi:hypothetical protein
LISVLVFNNIRDEFPSGFFSIAIVKKGFWRQNFCVEGAGNTILGSRDITIKREKRVIYATSA